jgi:Siphovirus Gp157.
MSDTTPTAGHNGGPDTADALAVLRSALLDPEDPSRSKLVTDLHGLLLTVATSDDPARATNRAKLEAVIARWDTERPEIVDDDQAAKATDCAGRVSAALKAEDDARTAAKRPYIDGGKRIDAVFKSRVTRLDAGLGDNRLRTGLRGRLIRWTELQQRIAAEARRKAEEEASRLAAEAQAAEQALREAAEAAAHGAPVDEALMQEQAAEAARLREQQAAAQASAPTGDVSRIRTDHGTLARTQTRYRVEITDAAALPRKYLIPDTACIKAALEAGQEIPGARLVPETVLTVR